MALVSVEIVNNSDQTIRRSVEEDSEEFAYLQTLVRREDLKSVRVLTTARKSAAK